MTPTPLVQRVSPLKMSKSHHYMIDKTADYEELASKLADALEEFLWAHAGGDDGRALPAICRNAIEIVEQYRKVAGRKAVGLKTLIQLAHDQAQSEGRDPYEAILETVAHRAKDCYDHMDDDREVYRDIQEWLKYEASLEVGS